MIFSHFCHATPTVHCKFVTPRVRLFLQNFGRTAESRASLSANAELLQRSILMSVAAVCGTVGLYVCLSGLLPEPHVQTSSSFLCTLPVAGLDILRRRSDMLCTSGFANDITFPTMSFMATCRYCCG